ncbi:hypothetical protein SAMN02745857_04327 [Andreprevotia lacus DSM 23236]|jgi:hypothetical protein|uniref:Uncharacterized protein n=1 Tax=Andreprevotia lacus DSM 23236 TaxID=1121001 RepID=A0A1W1Y1F0_9NEIS|nr:hypothetical protein [Andreprevotia lacus]SMC29983.1 hypothetical protein SAMN02745857_04327 [Andreprevotia lacus DSM 23236]
MNLQNRISLAVVLALAAVSSQAAAINIDFSQITGALDATSIITGIAAVAAIAISPRFARWGFKQVMSFFA